MSRYPNYLAPDAGSSPSRMLSKSAKSRARREPSGVFSLFQTAQIQQFKEAFSLIDQDGDGIVTEADLKAIFASLGINPSREILDELLNARPGRHRKSITTTSEDEAQSSQSRGVNFTMFLTMMGEHLFEFDSEQELIEAFECFDEGDTGFVKVDEMRRWLSEVGARMDQAEIDQLFKGPFTDRSGNFNYREWIKVLRINEDTQDGDSS
ncbi:calcium-binding EF-hand domain-containing protein [Auricularia subglabra TFB-10046 SS5]|nr:calcium-binding EF-hand domain-containing protein [Auricularia subglabra TFB-10046 SS5]